MYEILYRYLVKYKKLDLPGIGVLSVHLQPATAEFINHSILPPKYSIQFEQSENIPPERFFHWLASHLTTTEQEAVIRFNEFLFDINRQLKEGKQVPWPAVGVLHKEITGEILFNSEPKQFSWHHEVVAEKVTREDAEHVMLVGEREKTSTEMKQLLNLTEHQKKDHWWVWPLAIILALIIILFWHLSESGAAASTGNNNKLVPPDAPSGYNMSP